MCMSHWVSMAVQGWSLFKGVYSEVANRFYITVCFFLKGLLCRRTLMYSESMNDPLPPEVVHMIYYGYSISKLAHQKFTSFFRGGWVKKSDPHQHHITLTYLASKKGDYTLSWLE